MAHSSIEISGQRLARIRKSLLHTQESLARELDVAKNTIARYEASTRVPVSLPIMRRIARVLQMPVDRLRHELRPGAIVQVSQRKSARPKRPTAQSRFDRQ